MKGFTVLLILCLCLVLSFMGLGNELVVGKIIIVGNFITKDKIILRELPFHPGDTLRKEHWPEDLKRAHDNLINTSLFNFVTIDTLTSILGRSDLLITVKERWYFIPAPVIQDADRNFNSWLLAPTLYRTSYGVVVTDQNFRGMRENLSVTAMTGYIQQYALNYTLPFITKEQTHGLGIGISYTQSHEIFYQTFGNNLEYFKTDNFNLRKELGARVTYSYRKGLYNTHYGEIRFVNAQISDTISKLNSNYFGNGQTHFNSFYLRYAFKRDKRDAQYYPLKGTYFGIDFVKMGIGLSGFESQNSAFVAGLWKGYLPLGHRFYGSLMTKGKLGTNDKLPYFSQRALGFNSDYVRGYELYVIDGESFFLEKVELKYQLIKPATIHFSKINSEKFNTAHYALYLTLFSDGGYVQDHFNYLGNPLSNKWLMGNGCGLDFVSYYDIVIRAEYSLNNIGQRGWFLHFFNAF